MTDLATALPDLVLAPGTTITVTADDANAKITKLNVYGFTPARVVVPEFEVLPPLLAYGPQP